MQAYGNAPPPFNFPTWDRTWIALLEQMPPQYLHFHSTAETLFPSLQTSSVCAYIGSKIWPIFRFQLIIAMCMQATTQDKGPRPKPPPASSMSTISLKNFCKTLIFSLVCASNHAHVSYKGTFPRKAHPTQAFKKALNLCIKHHIDIRVEETHKTRKKKVATNFLPQKIPKKNRVFYFKTFLF